MLQQIKLFLFLLSILYLTRFLFEFIIKLFQENPETMKLSNIEKLSQLLSASYVITYFLI